MNEAEAMTDDDPYLWLEDVEGDAAVYWVKERNQATLPIFEADPDFDRIRRRTEDVLNAPDRIPLGSYDGKYIYNFWQDETHARGLMRRTTLDQYQSAAPKWEDVLDVDDLAESEGENWVYQDASILPEDLDRVLIKLSRGGADASCVREFDLVGKVFVDDGFVVSEAKTHLSWIDRDTLLIGTDFGDDSMTNSGYPRILKMWTRGTPLSSAATMFEADATDVLVTPLVFHRDGKVEIFAVRNIDFYETELFWLPPGKKPELMPFPSYAKAFQYIDRSLIFEIDEDWQTADGQSFSAGTVLAFDLDAYRVKGEANIVSIFAPTEKASVTSFSVSCNFIYMTVLHDVFSRMLIFKKTGGAWKQSDVAMPSGGSINLLSTSSNHDVVFASYESYLQSMSLFLLEGADVAGGPIKKLPARFDVEKYHAVQVFATSSDGIRIPYTLIRSRDSNANGSTPTLLSGYGGFNHSLIPTHVGPTSMQWLEMGGAVAIANIRGGGEYGPAWHRAALKQNRQIAYDDFIAVAEDLIATKITCPSKLAIQGGSNGGLLMGVMLTQRPDLFGAIICMVPLLDMMRYHLLLAGASWVAEYGNPEIADERDYLRNYSPYQNLSADAEYPPVFFITSTRDDRVHPGHARKMAARMMEQGHDLFYFENIEGGHGAAANVKQQAYMSALTLAYLKRQVMSECVDQPSKEE